MAMLSFAAKRSGFSIGLAFGKSNTERRVVNIMKKRKNNPIILCFALLLVAFCAVAFVTLPKESDARTIQDQSDDGIENNDKNSDADNDPDAQKIPTKTDCPENSNQKDTENPLLSSVKEVVQKEENLNFLKQISLGTASLCREREHCHSIGFAFFEREMPQGAFIAEHFHIFIHFMNGKPHKRIPPIQTGANQTSCPNKRIIMFDMSFFVLNDIELFFFVHTVRKNNF